jgi:nucleoside-diphosphate-sugar epimerase
MAAAEAGQPGLAYNIAGGTQASVREVIEIIGELTGSAIEVQHRDKVAGDAHRTGADTSRARQDLLYSPSVDLREGLSLQVAHSKGGDDR